MPFHEVQPDARWDRTLPYQRAGPEPPVVMLDDPVAQPDQPPPSLAAARERVCSAGFRRTAVAAVLSAAVGAGAMYGVQRGSSWSVPPDALGVRLDVTALVATTEITSGTPAMPLTLTYRGTEALRIAAVRYSSADGEFAWWGDGQQLVPGKPAQLWGYVQLSCGRGAGAGDGVWAEVFTPVGTDRLLRLRSGATESIFRIALHRACS